LNSQTICFATLILGLSITSVAFGQPFNDPFENGTNGWSFQNLLPTAEWKIDGSPALFTSPSNSLNNADTIVGLAESGTGDAYSPSAILASGSDKFIQFQCRYTFVEDEAQSRRLLNIGTGLPSGITHVGIFFDAPGSTLDDPVPGPSQFVVPCSNSSFHQHTIEATATNAELVIDGVVITGSASERDAIIGSASINVEFHFEWNELVMPGPTTVYGIVVWVVDDFLISDSLTSPFGGGGAPTSSGGGGGGGGGSSSSCSSTAFVQQTDASALLPAAIVVLILVLLSRRSVKKFEQTDP